MEAAPISGSSPLTRGKQLVLSVFLGGRGLIPAHAGKTWPVRAVSRFPGAHPRSRGENTRFCNEILLHPGSSPLTRGKHSHRNEQIPVPGLIPAHAGKTVMRPGPGGASWAHPRSRGENPGKTDVLTSADGSSPLTRGKLGVRGSNGVGGGLIPAHAGKTGEGTGEGGDRRAHPRSRGENWGGDACGVVSAGSSPLTRGKRRRSG